MRWLRFLGIGVGSLLIIAAGAYYWFFLETAMPKGEYAIDIAEVRRLAETVPGDRAAELRVEQVMAFSFPMAVAVAGSSWESVDVPVFSYQIAWPDRTIVVDTAVSENDYAKEKTFNAAAYARMQAAMKKASAIVITHEHPDHIGGLVAASDLPTLLPHTQLTQEQVDHPEKMFGLKFPEGALATYKPLGYERYHALAPGVVLIKAAGHTPGSQMVYVRLANGQEILLLGDIAWRFESVERLATRARAVSDLFLGEDRTAVLLELAALKKLHEAEPGIAMVAGHDARQMQDLLRAGIVVEGFRDAQPAP